MSSAERTGGAWSVRGGSSAGSVAERAGAGGSRSEEERAVCEGAATADRAKTLLAWLRGDVAGAGLRHVADWFDLCADLNAHGLLTRYVPEMVEHAPLPVSRKMVGERVRHNEKMAARLRVFGRFADEAEACHLRFALIKGMAASEVLYGDPFARDSNDVDVLVAADDLPKADYAARRAGWVQPAEAYRIRRLLDQGKVDAETLAGAASPYSLRSSTFLPHVTNYYYAHEGGRVDSMEVHDRFHGLDSQEAAGLLWSGRQAELEGRPFATVSDPAGFLLSALSLHDDAEGVRANNMTRDDMGLKTCADVHAWLLRLGEEGLLGEAAALARSLGVEREVGCALSCACEVFPEDVCLAEEACGMRGSAWSLGYLERSLRPRVRVESGFGDVSRALAQNMELGAADALILGSWGQLRRLPAVSGACETGFALRVEAAGGGLGFVWGMPASLASSADDLVMHAVVADLRDRDYMRGARVNVFREEGAWVAAVSPLAPGQVDGHANKRHVGELLPGTCAEEDGRVLVSVVVPWEELGMAGGAACERVLVVPSVNERVAGQLFRRCAGWDFIEVVEDAMGMR